MKELNLVYPEKSEIKYQVNRFPDGQQDVVIIDKSNLELHDVQIVSRFNSFKDLELILCSLVALRRLQVNWVSLFIPYLLGARSDRQFQDGGTSYLVDIVAPIMNQFRFSRVTVLDVHSDVAAACIHRLKNISNEDFIETILNALYPAGEETFYIVSPDAGSFKKLHKLADKINYNREMIICNKIRDTEGKLSNVVVPVTEKHTNSDLIIIDDICDGGASQRYPLGSRSSFNKNNLNKNNEIQKDRKRGNPLFHNVYGSFKQRNRLCRSQRF